MLSFLIYLDALILRILTFGKSRPGEAISAASWSLYLDGKWQGRMAVPIIDFIFRPCGSDHCHKSYQWQIHLYKGTA